MSFLKWQVELRREEAISRSSHANSAVYPSVRSLGSTHLIMLSFLVSTYAAALLSDGYKLQTDCKPAVAAFTLPDIPQAADEENNKRWIAVLPSEIKPLATAMFTLPTAPTNVGAPTAVARLDLDNAKLDHMFCSIPKEQSAATEVLGLLLDGAIQCWLAHCSSPEGAGSSFETLTASSTAQTAAVLGSRGFAEFDDGKIDFAALGRKEAIQTHQARLPAAILAYERRAAQADDVLDQMMAKELLDALKSQPDPPVGVMAPEEEAPKKDPWAGIKGFGL